MNRLTKTYSDGTHGANDNLPCGENSYTYKGLLLEALGKYEDAEEQGLLLRLPCKVESMVYAIDGEKIQALETENELVLLDDKLYIFAINSCYHNYISYDMIGKTVFLTREEAEQKLKEMESD